jgi:hypothetical protein
VTSVRRDHRTLLLLLPFLLSGCGVHNTLTGGGNSPSSAGGSPAPSATPWIVVNQGSTMPTPGPSYGKASPSASATGGFLALPTGGAVAAPAATCSPATYDFSLIDALTVTPGPTSGTANWYNVGGYNLVQFRMTAISQDVVNGKQRNVGWVTVTPTKPCGPVSATITGLNRRTHYVFSVDAVVTRRSGDGTHAATVFRSGVVATT